jgi:elongation factor Ts
VTVKTQVSAAQIKELREKTGAGLLDAKNALVEANGDMEKASEVLRQKGIASAEKKTGRAAAEGLIKANIAADGKSGVLLEINCETDFVARGEVFQGLVDKLADLALTSKVVSVEELLDEKITAKGKKTVADFIKENIGTIKENITLRRLTRYSIPKAKFGVIQYYIHTGSKIGVLLDVRVDSDKVLKSKEFQQLTKDLTLHIASAAPDFVTREEIPADVIETEKRIEMGKEDLAKKPPEIREKIVMGRIDKLLAQRVLLDQPFVKDPGKTITDLIEEQSKALKTQIEVKAFVRYLLGEGVEKKEANFVEEVMAQMKK